MKKHESDYKKKLYIYINKNSNIPTLLTPFNYTPEKTTTPPTHACLHSNPSSNLHLDLHNQRRRRGRGQGECWRGSVFKERC